MKKIISLFLSITMLFSITAGIDFSAYAGNNPYGGGNGNCTYYAWQRTKDKLDIELPKWGNAKTWYESAKKAGYTVSSKPEANWIGVYDGGKDYDNQYRGHVIFVESVNGNTMTYSEGGYSGGTHTGKRNISANDGDKKLLGYFNPDKKAKVKITFDANGGTPTSSSLTVDKGGTMGDNTPSATHINAYTFDGWYTKREGGNKYLPTEEINSNITLYAHWSQNQLPIKTNRIYWIKNINSQMAMQSTGSSNNSLVKQYPQSNSKSQLWEVTSTDGYYRFENLNSRKALDLTGGYVKLRNELQIYTLNLNNDNQKFSVINRGGFYSIHPKSSGRALDIRNTSKDAGAQLQQYYYHGGAAQQFDFVEYTDRHIEFYDNLSNNYLPTLREVYNYSGGSTPKTCYISRDTNYVTTSVNASQNKLIINQKKAGSCGKDMTFSTSVNGSYNYDMYNLDVSTMYLKFTAKSSVKGAKMYFRWGYDPTTNLKSITLNTYDTNYIIEMPRTLDSGSNIHPYIDTVCTVELSNIQLTQHSNSSVDLSNGDIFSKQYKDCNINNNSGTYGILPQPKMTKTGYIFDGWYNKREGGNKITSASQLYYNNKLYAHWVLPTDNNHSHNLITVGAIPATCTRTGSTGYQCCTICNKIIVDEVYLPKTEHSYNKSNSSVTKATTSSDGRILVTYTCENCGDSYSETTKIISKVSNIKLSNTVYTYNGMVEKPSVTVKDSKGKTISASNYTITYTSSGKNVGKHTVKITFKGNYSGTKTLSYTIKPKTTSIAGITAKSKGFTVKWKKQTAQTTGYQIQYSTSSNFSNAKTITVSKNSTTSKSISKLKGKKKYYVRVRTYKTVNGTKYYSDWSKAKSVTTKK